MKIGFNNIDSINSAMSFIVKKETLSECIFDVPNSNYRSFKIIKPVRKFYLEVITPSNNRWESSINLINIAGSNISNILFVYDFTKWDNIKDMTYRNFLHKQLEMYNFFNIENAEE